MKKSKSTEMEDVLDQTAVMEESSDSQSNEIQSDTQTGGEPIQGISEVEHLTNKRTGFWEISLEEADVRWIKNQCNSKFNFVGPNEAFMLMNCYLGFASALARHEQATKAGQAPGPFLIQAVALEACALMLNRFEGSGMESAQRVFRIAVALNGPISEMKDLDERIAELKASANQAED
jgi:hypothetical protein